MFNIIGFKPKFDVPCCKPPITSLLPSFQEPLWSARQEVKLAPLQVEELLQAHLPLKVAVGLPPGPLCPPG